MAADPLLHVAGHRGSATFHEGFNSAAHVLKTCRFRSKCREGTLQDAIGMDVVQDGTQLAAGTYFFTPAEATGTPSSLLAV